MSTVVDRPQIKKKKTGRRLLIIFIILALIAGAFFLNQRRLRRANEQALAQLDDRSRHIVTSRWLADDGGATLQDLADEYGVSAERIRQIEAKALKSLRTHLAPA